MMRKIVVTGASGLIGISVIQNLLRRNRDYFVLALANRDHPFFSTFDRNRFTFIQGDCKQHALVDSVVADSDAVIHLAAPASFLMYKENPIESTVDTVQIFLTIMEAMKKYNVKKIVHASTSAVYEGNALPYQERLPLHPPELKSLSKQMNEEIGKIYAASYGITSIALRPMSVYGDDESIKGGYANVISLFVWAMVGGSIPIVWGDGNQTRDFIHAADAAEVFCLALEKEIPTQPLNVGTGIETSFNQVIEIVNALRNTQVKPAYVPVPIDIYARRLLSDNSTLHNVLGFEPKISVREGIRRVIAHAESNVREHRDLADKQWYFQTLREKLVLDPT